MKPVRLVLDTNVLVSAFLWQGQPGRFLDLAAERQIRLFSSRVLLNELQETLCKRKLEKRVLLTGWNAPGLVSRYRRLVTLVRPQALPTPLSRDRDDDAVIACAIAARADAVVTGDDDLLSLRQVDGIPVLTPQQALLRL